MNKIKIILFLTLINNSLYPQDSLDKAIEQKYSCGARCPINICNTNPLCQIYSNQNMCLLQSQIPQQLQNLSYAIYPTQVDPYNTARFNYNKRFNIFPHAIFKPVNASQVAYLVSVMGKLNLNFAVRSGGHCYGPGSLSNGYVIDLSNFNEIIPNIEKQEVFIGAGNVLGNVIQILGNINYAIPTGDCSSVGVTGLALGGGIGFLARKYGLTSDSIKSITMVDANSNVIEVTATNKYSDLFWAMCGAGGGSFGVVLGFKFRMHKINKATLVKMRINWNETQLIELFQTWQNWIQSIPDDISSEFNFIYRSGVLSVSINSLRVNAPFTQWKNVFDKFNPQIDVTTGSYLDCAKKTASSYTQPFSKAKSKFLFSPLSDAGVQVIINNFNSVKQQNMPFLMFAEIGAGKGKLAQGDSAYFPRNAFLYAFLFIYWNLETQSKESLDAITKLYDEFEPFTSPYSYANLVDFQLGDTYLNAYYGTHVSRLIRIKNKYDPTNLFRWQQSIPLTQ